MKQKFKLVLTDETILKHVIRIKHDNNNLGWIWEESSDKTIHHSSNQSKIGGHIARKALKGLPDNMMAIITWVKLPDNKDMERR
jgi:hypothetical protein